MWFGGPPVRHPVPIPWGRWAAYWAGPCLALFGILAYVGWNLPRNGCSHGTETSAISALRNISSCQDRFRKSIVVDEDGDELGEFGGFYELSGALAPRGREKPISPPVLSGAFRTLGADGHVSRAGYRFRIFLVGKEGPAIGELQRIGFDEGEIDPDASEKRWICYAWPEKYGLSGDRSFVVTEEGGIYGTDCPSYSGASGPRPGAALLSSAVPPPGAPAPGFCCGVSPDPLDLLDAVPADGVPARDGNVWKRIN